MRKYRLRDIIESTFAGNWGEEPLIEGSSENVRVIRSTELGDRGIAYSTAAVRRIPRGELGSKRLLSGDLIIECSGGGPGRPVGRVAIFDDDSDSPFTCSNFLRCIRVSGDVARPGYINRYLQWVYQKPIIERFQQQTTGIINLNFREYLDQEIELPPLGEQQRIARILDSVDGKILRLERLNAKLRTIERAILASCMEVARSDTGYEEPAVGDVGLVHLGRQRSPVSEVATGGTPYLRVANVFDGFIDYSDVLSMAFSTRERSFYELLPGDILLNEGQSLELVGRSAIFDGPSEMCFQNTLVRFRCGPDVLPEYAHMVFQSWLYSGSFMAVAKQTTSIAHLGADRFAKMAFPLIPLELQRDLVHRLNVVRRTRESYRAELAKTRTVREGLAADLLSGRVRAAEVA